MGLGRNLHADEIVDQALHAAEILAEDGKTLTHVVFMGMGEPLLNLKHVVQAIRVLTHEDLTAHNTFEEPDTLGPRRDDALCAGTALRLPPASVAVVTWRG